MAVELYINERKIQLGEDSIIALDRQINGLAELKDRQADLTNQIKIPRTSENNRILGYAAEITTTSKAPYRRLPARVIQNGINIIPSGVATIKSVSEDIFTIVIYGGNANFFAAIEDLDINQLDLTDLDHTWDFNTVRDNRLNTEGYIYALHDPQNGAVNTNGNIIDPSGVRPQVFVHTLVDRIIDEAGFKNVSDFLNTDPFYRSHVIAIDKLQGELNVSSEFKEDRTFKGARNTDGSEVTVTAGALVFNKIFYPEDGGTPNPSQVLDPLGQWDPATSEYTANDAHIVTFGIEQTFKFSAIKNSGPSSSVDIELEIGVFLNSFEVQRIYSQSSPVNPINLEDGEDITFDVVANSFFFEVQPTDTVDVRVAIRQLEPVAQWEVKADFKRIHDPEGTGRRGLFGNIIFGGVVYGGKFFFKGNLPELNQLDLIKGVAQEFGLIFDTNAKKKEINAVKFETIEENKDKAVDMTNKLDISKPYRKSHNFGNQYNQKNWIRYLENEEEILPSATDGFFLIDDKNLKGEDDLFELPFIGTPQKKKLISGTKSVYMASFTYGAQDKPRIFALRDVNENYALSDGVDTEPNLNPWKACYFETPLESDSGDTVTRDMTAQSFIDEDYQVLIRVLNNLKVLEEEFFIDEQDIIDINFFIPIFVKGQGNFYINRIKKFTEGKSTTFQIIKI